MLLGFFRDGGLWEILKIKTSEMPFAAIWAAYLSAILGPVHMGRSYLGSQENISTSQIMLFCSYGEMFSRLPGKVSRGDVDFVKCKQKVFPLSGK